MRVCVCHVPPQLNLSVVRFPFVSVWVWESKSNFIKIPNPNGHTESEFIQWGKCGNVAICQCGSAEQGTKSRASRQLTGHTLTRPFRASRSNSTKVRGRRRHKGVESRSQSAWRETRAYSSDADAAVFLMCCQRSARHTRSHTSTTLAVNCRYCAWSLAVWDIQPNCLPRLSAWVF